MLCSKGRGVRHGEYAESSHAHMRKFCGVFRMDTNLLLISLSKASPPTLNEMSTWSGEGPRQASVGKVALTTCMRSESIRRARLCKAFQKGCLPTCYHLGLFKDISVVTSLVYEKLEFMNSPCFQGRATAFVNLVFYKTSQGDMILNIFLGFDIFFESLAFSCTIFVPFSWTTSWLSECKP